MNNKMIFYIALFAFSSAIASEGVGSPKGIVACYVVNNFISRDCKIKLSEENHENNSFAYVAHKVDMVNALVKIETSIDRNLYQINIGKDALTKALCNNHTAKDRVFSFKDYNSKIIKVKIDEKHVKAILEAAGICKDSTSNVERAPVITENTFSDAVCLTISALAGFLYYYQMIQAFGA